MTRNFATPLALSLPMLFLLACGRQEVTLGSGDPRSQMVGAEKTPGSAGQYSGSGPDAGNRPGDDPAGLVNGPRDGGSKDRAAVEPPTVPEGLCFADDDCQLLDSRCVDPNAACACWAIPPNVITPTACIFCPDKPCANKVAACVAGKCVVRPAPTPMP